MKVTIVTATFNSAATLGDTLRSVDAQTHADIEHIIVDGGSTDATLAVVQALGGRVARIISEPDRGIYDGMNKGLAAATGEIVGTLNSDDFYADDRTVAAVVSAFADPAVDAVYGDLCYVAADRPERIVRYWRSSRFAPGLFARGWAPPHPTLFVRRRILAEHGDFDISQAIVADLDLMVRYFEVHRLRTLHVPRVLVHMRTGGASNRGVAAAWSQNRAIWSILKRHGVARSPWTFALHKLWSRGRQFVSRPDTPTSGRGERPG